MNQEWTGALDLSREGNPPLWIHLIGVAGSGMSGLALLLMGMGHRVSGSDRVTTQETERMERLGLDFTCPHTAESVEGADLVVYSSAIRPGNAAYDAAVSLGIPMIRRAEALAAILNAKKGIIVAGTHGKTTTSSLCAHALRAGGRQPSHYVGAEIPILGSNALWVPETPWMVAEGDESDGTLVNYRPEHGILLNIEAEHLDHYKDLDAIKDVFATLLDQTAGSIVYCGEDPVATELAGPRERSVSYGWSKSQDYSAHELKMGAAESEFDVFARGQSLGRVRLNIPGRHNVLNALAVIALTTEMGVPFDKVAEALGSFQGARRRFERKYESETYAVFDDYGHHPSEIRATLQTARSCQPKRLICLFQPHRYTRTQLMKDEFGAAFDAADRLYVADIYPASEPPIPGISGETIVDAVKASGGVEAFSHPDKKTIHWPVGNQVTPGDFILTLGAGDIHEAGTRLAADLKTLEKLRTALDEEDAVIRLYEPMRRHTTLKVGGPAQFWVEPSTARGLSRLIVFCKEVGLPLSFVGRGSNLLVRDGGIPGVVAHLDRGEFSEFDVNGGDTIRAGAGIRFKKLSAIAQNAGLGGFEWMEGIPGNVGGGIRMNAGAMGSATFDQVVSVRFVDETGEIREKTVTEIEPRYRDTPEFEDQPVVSVVFRGRPATDAAEISRLLDASKEKRKTSQPVAACAGCIFKNPETVPAGMLVDQLGLKNQGEGRARVSEVHGNFIVNDGDATARDVLDLIARIQETARQERGIELETEVKIVGVDAPSF